MFIVYSRPFPWKQDSVKGPYCSRHLSWILHLFGHFICKGEVSLSWGIVYLALFNVHPVNQIQDCSMIINLRARPNMNSGICRRSKRITASGIYNRLRSNRRGPNSLHPTPSRSWMSRIGMGKNFECLPLNEYCMSRK